MPAGRHLWPAALITVAATLAAVPASAAPAPVTYNVTTPVDGDDSPAIGNPGPDGQVSLREARNWSQTDATNTNIIVLPAGHYQLIGAIQFTNGNDFSIVGHGAADTVIDSGGTARVFRVMGGGTKLTISDATVTGGSAVPVGGGGILNDGSPSELVLRRV